MGILKLERIYFILFWFMLCVYAIGLAWWIHQDTVPPLPDQSQILRQSLHHYSMLTEKPLHEALPRIMIGYHYYPPLVPLTAALFYLGFGTDSDVAVLSSLIFLGLLFWSVFALGRYLSGSGAGLLATFLTATSPIIIGYSREFWLDIPVTGMLITFLYFLIRSKNLESNAYSIGLGIVCGLGMLTKWNFAFFAAGPIAITLWPIYKDTWPSWKQRILIGLVVILTIFSGFLSFMLLAREARILVKIVMFAGVLLIGVAVVPAVWQRLKQLIPWDGPGPLKYISEKTGRSWLNVMRVIVIVLILCGPWYLNSIPEMWSNFKAFGINAAAQEGDPPSLSVPSAMYNVWNLLNGQLFLPFSLLSVIGIFWAVRKRLSHRDWAMMISYLVIGYLILTIIPNKSHRYTLPLLPVVLILASAWVCSRRRVIYFSLAITSVVVGLIQYLAIGFGYALVDRTISIPLPQSSFTEYRGLPSQVVVYSTAGKMYKDLDAYYSHPPLKEKWPLDSILETVSNNSSEREPTLVVATSERFLNYFNLLYFSELMHWQGKVLHYRFAQFRSTPEKWEGIHYLLARSDDSIIQEVKMKVGRRFSFMEIKTVQTWNLPDNSEVELIYIEAS